jgi:hypothetical protein
VRIDYVEDTLFIPATKNIAAEEYILHSAADTLCSAPDGLDKSAFGSGGVD